MTLAMVTSRAGSRSLESPSLGNLHNGFGEGREGHMCSALGKPELTANATRLAPTLHRPESFSTPDTAKQSSLEPPVASHCAFNSSARRRSRRVGALSQSPKDRRSMPMRGYRPINSKAGRLVAP
jgi:hypothetical protein